MQIYAHTRIHTNADLRPLVENSRVSYTCACVCVQVYVFMYTYIHIYTHIQMRTADHRWRVLHVCMCISIRIHIYVHTHIHTHKRRSSVANSRASYSCVCVYAYVFIHTYIHIYIHTNSDLRPSVASSRASFSHRDEIVRCNVPKRVFSRELLFEKDPRNPRPSLAPDFVSLRVSSTTTFVCTCEIS